jgi:hypothetical protein
VFYFGGLDSSITSAVAKKDAQNVSNWDVADAWYPIALFFIV